MKAVSVMWVATNKKWNKQEKQKDYARIVWECAFSNPFWVKSFPESAIHSEKHLSVLT